VKFFVGGCNNYDMKQEVHKRIEIEMMPQASLTALAEKLEKFSSKFLHEIGKDSSSKYSGNGHSR